MSLPPEQVVRNKAESSVMPAVQRKGTVPLQSFVEFAIAQMSLKIIKGWLWMNTETLCLSDLRGFWMAVSKWVIYRQRMSLLSQFYRVIEAALIKVWKDKSQKRCSFLSEIITELRTAGFQKSSFAELWFWFKPCSGMLCWSLSVLKPPHFYWWALLMPSYWLYQPIL